MVLAVELLAGGQEEQPAGRQEYSVILIFLEIFSAHLTKIFKFQTYFIKLKN